ncbi:MAG: HEAT repeat domain-containing protein [Bryobacteraceae bacterium]|jgi:TolA-binding protein
MNGWRILLAAGVFVAAGVLACAQTPEPQPAPESQPAQAPIAPMAPVAPLPPMVPDVRPEVQEQIEKARAMAQDQAAEAREMAEEAREQAREQTRGLDDQLREQARALADMARQQSRLDLKDMHVDFAQDWVRTITRHSGSEDGLYDSGQRALDSQRYDEALTDFKEVVSRAGNHSDGALYWEAYTLNKMARRDEASAAIATLCRNYPNSRWLEDAKALEVEVKQAAGRNVSPETQNDDELKLLALNGLMQNDPDRAFPILENLLRSAQSPKLKDRALFVLAENNSTRSQQLLERFARGNANPDLQVKAIQYIGELRAKQPNGSQLLVEIYGGGADPRVKRAVINALMNRRDAKAMVDIGRREKDPELKKDIVRRLVDMKSPDATAFLEEILK